MSERLDFRPLRDGDLEPLAEWLRRPHVAAWWDTPGTVAELRAEFLEPRGDEVPPVEGYIALLDGRPIGFVQQYRVASAGGGWWPDERDPGARGIDQFLADEADLGRGLGTRMVRAFVARLFADPAVTRVQVDPHPRNARAIRCYEKAGFRAERETVTPDGPALLMYCERPRSPEG